MAEGLGSRGIVFGCAGCRSLLLDFSGPEIIQALILGLKLESISKRSMNQLPALNLYLVLCISRYIVFVGYVLSISYQFVLLILAFEF